jgi:hypothetical protein
MKPLPRIATTLLAVLLTACTFGKPSTSASSAKPEGDKASPSVTTQAAAGTSSDADGRAPVVPRKAKQTKNETVVDATTKNGTPVVATPDSVALAPQALDSADSEGESSLVATIGATTPKDAPSATVPLEDLPLVPLTPNTTHSVVISEQQASGELRPVDEATVTTPPRSPEVLRVDALPNGNVAVHVDVHDNPAGTDLALVVTATGSGEMLGNVDVKTGGAAKPGHEFGEVAFTPAVAVLAAPASTATPTSTSVAPLVDSTNSTGSATSNETVTSTESATATATATNAETETATASAPAPELIIPSNVVVIVVKGTQLPAPAEEVEFSVQAQSEDDKIVTDPSEPVGLGEVAAEEAADNEAVQSADEAISSDDGGDAPEAKPAKDPISASKAEVQALRDALRAIADKIKAARQELKLAHAELHRAREGKATNVGKLEATVQSIRSRIQALKRERTVLRDKIKASTAELKKAKREAKGKKDKDEDENDPDKKDKSPEPSNKKPEKS